MARSPLHPIASAHTAAAPPPRRPSPLPPAPGRVPDHQAAPSWNNLRTLAAFVLGLTLVTQLVYPIMYQPLVHGGPLLLLATVVLVLRNVALVAFLIWLALLVGPTLRAGRTSGAVRDQNHNERQVSTCPGCVPGNSQTPANA